MREILRVAMVIDLRLFQTLWIFPYLLFFPKIKIFRKEILTISNKRGVGFPTKLLNIVTIEYVIILFFVFIGCLVAVIGSLNYFSIVNLSITENWGSEFEFLLLIFFLIALFEYVFVHLNTHLFRSI